MLVMTRVFQWKAGTFGQLEKCYTRTNHMDICSVGANRCVLRHELKELRMKPHDGICSIDTLRGGLSPSTHYEQGR